MGWNECLITYIMRRVIRPGSNKTIPHHEGDARHPGRQPGDLKTGKSITVKVSFHFGNYDEDKGGRFLNNTPSRGIDPATGLLGFLSATDYFMQGKIIR